jgi:hypothetical protein
VTTCEASAGSTRSRQHGQEDHGDMGNLQKFPRISRTGFWAVFALFLALMGLAHGGAELMVPPDSRGEAAIETIVHYRVIFTIWATVVLLTPALCFFIFSGSGAANTYWRLFWTFSFLAFLAHFYWTVVGTFHGDIYAIFHSKAGEAPPDKVVEQPGPDFALSVWWGLDVLLAWFASQERKWIWLQRIAVHLLAFVMFVGATIVAEKAGVVVRGLGIVMTIAVLGSLVLRGWWYLRPRNAS